MTEQSAKIDTLNITNSIDTVARLLQFIISLGVGIAAVLSGGGFIVVNSYLARYTDIHGYGIRTEQYLTAGIGLLFPPLIAIALIILLYQLGRMIGRLTMWWQQQRHVNSEPDISWQKGVDMPEFIGFFNERLVSIVFRRYLFFSGIVLYAVLFGWVYGNYIYGNVPYYLGGGAPQTIVLIFTETDVREMFNLSADAQHPEQSGAVLLLAETEDGLLVADTTTGQVAAVKHENFIGIRDDQIADWYITLTPTATPSPTATP